MPDKIAKHTIAEFCYRFRSPAWVLSHSYRLISTAYDPISQPEFSTNYRLVRKNTMCSNARLMSLYRAVKYIIRENIPGDIVECGVAGGGSAALMALTLKQMRVLDKNIWLYDTFEVLPPPNKNDPDFRYADIYTGTCCGSVDHVSNLFIKLGVERYMRVVKGLFNYTLPRSKPAKIALLHIDADWHDSVKSCLYNLYDSVSVGGIIQFDDYGYWKGAKKAVDDFFTERLIDPDLKRIDYSGMQYFKPSCASCVMARGRAN